MDDQIQPAVVTSTSEPAKPTEIEKFSKFKIHSRRINSSLLRFHNFYHIKKFKSKMMVAIMFGFVLSIAAVVMVEHTGLYTGGTSAFFQGFARLIFVIMNKNQPDQTELNAFVFNFLYWALYLFLNLCLGVFAYKKIGKEFTYLSIAYIISTQVFGFIFGWIFDSNQISFNIFGTTQTVDENLAEYGVKCIYFNPTYFPGLIDGQVLKYDWTKLYTESELYATYPNQAAFIIETVRNANAIRTYSLFVYALVFAFITAIINAILYIIGGSSGGSDFYSVYYARKHNKSLGYLYTIVNGIFMFLGVLLGSFGAAVFVDGDIYFSLNTLFSVNLISSFVWVLMSGIMIDIFFPKDKWVEIVIGTDKIDPILNYLAACNYPHLISNSITYSANNTTHNRLITICYYNELPKLIRVIRKFDENCLITAKIIKDIDGVVDVAEGID